MNNFIFENGTRAVFGKGCVKEYLGCFSWHFGDTVMLAYGGGSIHKNGIYEEVVSILKAAGKNCGILRYHAQSESDCRFLCLRPRRLQSDDPCRNTGKCLST